jgi:2-keto-4-pentenoate hydratase
MDVNDAVEAVWAGFERNVRPAESIRGELDVEKAYQVQTQIMQRLIDRGETVVGWKIGGNSDAARALFSTVEPFSGFLLATGRYESGSEFDLSALPGSPVLECELAFTFKRRLEGDVSREEVLSAIDTIAPALEIAAVGRVAGLDLGQIVGDNVSQWGYVVGRESPLDPDLELGSIEVVAQRNGAVEQRGLSREVIDNQIESLVWLVQNLAKIGMAVEVGHIVMSGSCLRPAIVSNNEHWTATFSGLGCVEAKFIRSAA